MALSARDRSSIYTKLVPLLGEREADVLMSEFPAHEADELVTRSILRAEMAELRTEISERLQRQTSWVVGTIIGSLVGGMGVAATIASVIG